MERARETNLIKWFKKPQRKPLVLRGARQVGKSTIVENLAEKLGVALKTVNLERHTNLALAFETKSVERILEDIQALPGIGPIGPHDLLFLDEIQAVPAALPALRYFYEDRPDIPLIAAGSLLEFALKDHQYSMPVGRVEYLHLYPMTFTEFLKALGEDHLINLLDKMVEEQRPLGQASHDRLSELQRRFCYVGGMPEAVQLFASGGDIHEIRDVHDSILQTYRDDFPKYIGKRNLARFHRVFDYCGMYSGQKIKYSNIDPGEQSRSLRGDLDLLTDAKIVHRVYHSSGDRSPLKSQRSEKLFKSLFLDVGLAAAMANISWQAMKNMSQKDLNAKGSIAEQFVGQHMVHLTRPAVPAELHYWLREGKANNAEVDYLVESDSGIIPVEVKSGKSGRLRSIKEFLDRHDSPTGIRFDTNPFSILSIDAAENRQHKVVSLPLYAVATLEQILSAQ